MTDTFFSGQMDYIIFLYGLTFMLLAIICSQIQDKTKYSLSWNWLSLFGITFCIQAWQEMLVLSLGDSPAFSIIRLCNLTVSYILLLEFGRVATIAHRGRGPGIWIFVPLLVLASLGSLAGLTGLNAAIHYALGMVGGVWSACVMFQVSRNTRSRPLLFASAGMAVYALGTGINVPKSSFFPASAFNTESFYASTGFPIEMVLTVLGVVITFALWTYYLAINKAGGHPEKPAIKTNPVGRLLFLMTVILLGGWLATFLVGNNSIRAKQHSLIDRANLAATTLEKTVISRLTGFAQDSGTPDYNNIKSKLQDMRQSNSDLRFIYLLTARGDNVVFMVDSEPESSKACSPPGQVYKEASPELHAAFKSPAPFIEGPLPDPWGVWISGFVPIFDSASSLLLTILGMDIDAKAWQQEVFSDRLQPISITLLLVMLLCFYFFDRQQLWRRTQQSLRHQAALMELARADITDLYPALQRIANTAARTLAVERVSIWRYGKNCAEIVCDTLYHLSTDSYERGQRLQAENYSRYFQALQESRTIAARDARSDPRTSQFFADYLLPLNIFSLLDTPIWRQGSMIGIICIEHVDEPRTWMPEEADFAIALADMVALALEAAERKKTEETLKQSEVRFHRMADGVQNGISIIEQGRLVYVNRKVCEIFGYPAEELLQKNIADLISGEDRERILPIMAESQQTGIMPLELEFRIIRGDDSRRYIRNTYSPSIRDGKVVGRYVVTEDITERMQAANNLQRRDEILEAVAFAANRFLNAASWEQVVRDVLERVGTVTAVSRVYVFTNHAGADSGLLTSMSYEWVADGITPQIYNPELQGLSYRTMGFRRWEEMLGQGRFIQGHLSDFSAGEQTVLAPQNIRSILIVPIFAGERWWGFIGFDECREEREWSPLELGPIKAVADALGAAIQRRQIEEEKHTIEVQLYQAQKMEAVGHLAGGIAHDFNNILTAIMGYANLLQIKLKSDEHLRKYIEPILISAERAANLVRSLLAFGRKQIIDPRPLKINDVVTGVEKILTRVIGEDLELKTGLTHKNTMVMADAGQIEQILMNLATNARDAMPAGGCLNISTGLAEIDAGYIKTHGYGKAGTYVLLSVSDTGAGMDKKIQKRVFEPFFTTKEVGKGTGLGLSMVYGIVKQHDGFINCYSAPGQGTTFKIYLPAFHAEKEVQAQGADILYQQPAVEKGFETLLLAEDDAALRAFIKELLEEYGYSVIAAEDGEDAIKLFAEHQEKIMLLLFDIIMPRMNGKKAYEEIKQLCPDIKVLFMSGYTANIMHQRGILDKEQEFILKPVSPTNLLQKVREVLNKEALPQLLN